MEQRDAGDVQEITPGLRRLIAPNAGPMTHWGTNTFLLGERQLAVIDPGPDDPAHRAAILRAVGDSVVTHVLVTHAHLDHSPLARRLAEETGATVYAFGTAAAGRRPVMQGLVAAGLSGGGEGVDTVFRPDEMLGEGDRLEGEDWAVEVLHTPGHFAGHLAFRWCDWLLSGDHVMDWSSSLVSPPDGDLSDFMATSRRLRDMGGVRFLPAHGGAIHDPSERLGWLIAHREAREASIRDALSGRPQTVATLTRRVYTDIPDAMLPAAERNTFAHLIDLVDRNLAFAEPRLAFEAGFRRP